MPNDQAYELRREIARKEQTIRALAKDVIIEDSIIGSVAIISKMTGVNKNRVLEVINEQVAAG